MGIVKRYLKIVEKEAVDNQIRFVHLGRKDRLSKDVARQIEQLEEKTKHYSKYLLNLAFDYGGRDEIIRAIQGIVADGIPIDKIDSKLVESYLDTAGQPYPYVDLFIRTSGEQRTSGLMPWQMEYAEYYFESVHLPDFTPEKLKSAVLDYSRRRRRFGGNDVVEHFAFKPQMVANFEVNWWRLQNIPKGTRFRDYAVDHLRAQYGLSKELAREAAGYLLEAVAHGDMKKWDKALIKAKKFYKLIKGELKLAFEPRLVASLQVKLWQDLVNKDTIEATHLAEETARELYAETYRISLLQAAKLAHLRVLANLEKNKAQAGMGKEHWDKAQDYLEKFYAALKDRVA